MDSNARYDDELDKLAALVMAISWTLEEQLRAAGAEPSIGEPPLGNESRPPGGWPEWCEEDLASQPPEKIQHHVNRAAICLAWYHAHELGLTPSAPDDGDIQVAAWNMAYTRTKGAFPRRDWEKTRCMLMELGEEETPDDEDAWEGN